MAVKMPNLLAGKKGTGALNAPRSFKTADTVTVAPVVVNRSNYRTGGMKANQTNVEEKNRMAAKKTGAPVLTGSTSQKLQGQSLISALAQNLPGKTTTQKAITQAVQRATGEGTSVPSAMPKIALSKADVAGKFTGTLKPLTQSTAEAVSQAKQNALQSAGQTYEGEEELYRQYQGKKLNGTQRSEVFSAMKRLNTVMNDKTAASTDRAAARSAWNKLHSLDLYSNIGTYTVGQVASGMENTLGGIAGGTLQAAGDLARKATGKTNTGSAGITALEQYFQSNPQDAPNNLSTTDTHYIQRIARKSGVDAATVKSYLESGRGAQEEAFTDRVLGQSVNKTYKKTAGMAAQQIGQQIPGLLLGIGAPETGAERGLISNLINGNGAKAALQSALKGNVSTYLIGASSYSQKINQLARTHQVSTGDYADALGTAFTEYFTEGLFGFSDLNSYKALFSGATGSTSVSIMKAVGKYLLSGAEEGLEEVVADPMEAALDKATIDHSKPLVGNGGVFDAQQMLADGVSGAAVALIMGGVANISGLYGTYRESQNIQQAAETLNNTINTFNKETGASIDTVDASHMTQEQLDTKAGEVLDSLENYAEGQKNTASGVETGKQFQNENVPDSQGAVAILRGNLDKLAGMEPLANVTGTEISKEGKATDRAMEFIRKIGGEVKREGLGNVLFSKSKIKNSLIGHGFSEAKLEMLAGVPDVIRNGKQIGYAENWKGRGYDSYVFAGPINYKGNRAFLTTIVIRDSNNRYYLHEAVDQNGNLIYGQKESPDTASDRSETMPRNTVAGTELSVGKLPLDHADTGTHQPQNQGVGPFERKHPATADTGISASQSQTSETSAGTASTQNVSPEEQSVKNNRSTDDDTITRTVKNKDRTNTWLQSLGLQLPSDSTKYGSIGNVSYTGSDVNIQGKPETKKSDYDILPKLDTEEKAGTNQERKSATSADDGYLESLASDENKPAQKKQENRPTQAKKDLKQDLLNLYSVPAGSRAVLGSNIDAAANEMLKTLLCGGIHSRHN